MFLCTRFRDIAAPLALILLGLMLLTKPAPAQAFTPTRFTVVDAGTTGKPDVVLIPGLNSSRAVWDNEAKLLAPKYRLHLVQLNGFAGQPAGPNASGPILAPVVNELHAYITASKIKPAMIGHSLGGLITMLLAEQHPADVSRVIIVDSLPFYPLVMSPDATPENTAPRVKAMAGMMAQMSADQYAASQTMTAMQLVKNADAQKLVAAASAASDRTVAINAMIEDLSTDTRPALASITAPLLLLYPYDAAAQGPDSAKLDALYTSAFAPVPHHTVVRVDDSRHFIMYDQPAKFDEAVQAFLKQ